ncbi:MAG: type I-E CRISPR-associated protein Cas6/Cse3/CasE [Thermodesulfobacteriota bacterium]
MHFSRIRIRPEIFRSTQLAKILTDSPYNKHRLLWDLFSNERQRNFLYREEIAREQFPAKAGVRGEPLYYVISSNRPFLESPFFLVEAREYHPKLQNGDRLNFELRANPVASKKVDRDNPELYLKERSFRQVADKNKLTKKRVRHDVVMDAQKKFLTSLCAELDLQSCLPPEPEKKEYKRALLTHGGLALDERLTAFLKDDLRYSDRLRPSMPLQDKLEWSIKANIDDALEKWVIKQGEKHGFSLDRDYSGQCKLQSSAYQWHPIKADKGKKSGFSSVDFLGALEVTDVEQFREALFRGIGRSKAFGCGLLLVKRI